eukprot:CAMPEP_0195572874 /NCGR_PEP_ID=MMETSP0814-20130614/4996_1 /TAXON_ID=97485 /ORGANISM="Prymnesium parvum, Strain Texoma1" /LENGTH=114 /DNA_ID=CAMNT_0040708685 /DNA_START=552 /DNA_END=893 /DNA_ORIENTATION=-
MEQVPHGSVRAAPNVHCLVGGFASLALPCALLHDLDRVLRVLMRVTTRRLVIGDCRAHNLHITAKLRVCVLKRRATAFDCHLHDVPVARARASAAYASAAPHSVTAASTTSLSA